ncbi:MAG: hypothetical protein K0S39_81 [Paenibacillus sp.]|jgi:hypothetical protein|nr:hypothetical protein [Paenibacillus sp.]
MDMYRYGCPRRVRFGSRFNQTCPYSPRLHIVNPQKREGALPLKLWLAPLCITSIYRDKTAFILSRRNPPDTPAVLDVEHHGKLLSGVGASCPISGTTVWAASNDFFLRKASGCDTMCVLA